MTNNPEPGTVRHQILQRMKAKTTRELVQAWRRNDRTRWTRAEFKVIHDILLERLGDVPAQNAPPANDTPGAQTRRRARKAKPVREERELFHDPQKTLGIAFLARMGSWIVLLLGVGLIIVRLLSDAVNFRLGGLLQREAINSIAYGFGYNAISWGSKFIILWAISVGLYVCLDFAENTRPKKGDRK